MLLVAHRADGTQTLLFPWGMRRPEDRVYRALGATCQQLHQPEFTAHGLRRMVVNRLLRQGVDLKVAAEVMLTRYRRVSQEDKAAGVSKAGLGEALPVAARWRRPGPELGAACRARVGLSPPRRGLMASLRHVGAALRFDEPQLSSTALSEGPSQAGHRFWHIR